MWFLGLRTGKRSPIGRFIFHSRRKFHNDQSKTAICPNDLVFTRLKAEEPPKSLDMTELLNFYILSLSVSVFSVLTSKHTFSGYRENLF